MLQNEEIEKKFLYNLTKMFFDVNEVMSCAITLYNCLQKLLQHYDTHKLSNIIMVQLFIAQLLKLSKMDYWSDRFGNILRNFF